MLSSWISSMLSLSAKTVMSERLMASHWTLSILVRVSALIINSCVSLRLWAHTLQRSFCKSNTDLTFLLLTHLLGPREIFVDGIFLKSIHCLHQVVKLRNVQLYFLSSLWKSFSPTLLKFILFQRYVWLCCSSLSFLQRDFYSYHVLWRHLLDPH